MWSFFSASHVTTMLLATTAGIAHSIFFFPLTAPSDSYSFPTAHNELFSPLLHQSYLSPFASSSTRIHSLAITVITLAWKPLFKSCQAQPNHAKSPQHNRSAPPIHAAGGSLLSPGRTHRCYMLCPFSYIYLSYLSRNHMFNIVLKALKCYHSALPVMRQLSDNQKIAFTLIFNLIIT